MWSSRLNQKWKHIKNAQSAVNSSGVAGWEWGDVIENPLEKLADFCYRRGGEFRDDDHLLREFVIAEGDDPEQFSL